MDELCNACVMARVEEKADFYLLTVVTKGKKGGLLNCVLPMAIFINELMGISLTCWDLHDGIEQTQNLKEHMHGKLAVAIIKKF